MCYNIDEIIIKIEDFDFYNISLHEKLFENILIFDFSNSSTLISKIPFCILVGWVY